MSRERAAEEAAALYLRIDANPDAAEGLVDYSFRMAHVSRTPAAQAFMPAFWRYVL